MDNFKIVELGALSEDIQNLLKTAVEARKRSYSPYSNFAVGSAIVTEEDNKIYTGCNIESATAAPTICAERTAIGKAVSEGYLKIKAVAVIAHQNAFTAPCGVCRQSLSEFRSSNGNIDIYLSKPGLEQVLCTTISQLLPLAYVSHREDSISQ